MNRRFLRLGVTLWIGLVFLGGCAEAELTAVEGAVTLDGQPVEQGVIQFVPTDGQAPSQGAKIEGGKFSTELHRTQYKVEIFSPKVTKRAGNPDEKGPGDASVVEELVPARYNVRSELTLDVTGPKSDVRFELKSK